MPKAAATNKITPIDVTKEYLDAAAPGQGAAKQIRTIPGGVILDISASGLSIEKIEAAIVQRIPRVALDSMDAMLIAKQRLEKVLRCKK